MEFTEEELEEVLSIFREESEEQIQKLNENLLKLEVTPSDSGIIQEIFREAHSLKGAARMIGLDDIQSIAHKLEDIFGLARKGEFSIQPEVIDVMCQSVDAIATIIEETVKNKGSTSVDVQAIINLLKVIEEGGSFEEAPIESDEDMMSLQDSEPFKTEEETDLEVTDEVDTTFIETPDSKETQTDDNFSFDEMAELKQIFYAESKNNIEFINSSIQKLKKYPYDKEALTEVYRIAHALEGSAKIIEFTEIIDLTHGIRDIFEQAVKEEIFINADILSTLEKYLKQVENSIGVSFKKDGYEKELSLEELEKQIEVKMESYRKKEEKPKKAPRSKISLSSESINIDEKDLLKDFGVISEEEQAKPKKSIEITKKRLEMDPLSLTDDELGELELGSLKGIKPLNIPEEKKQEKPDQPSKNIISSSHSFKHHLDEIEKKEKSLSASDSGLDDLLNYLSDNLRVLSLNVNNKNVLSKAKENASKIKNIATLENKPELLAIITEVATIFEELNEEEYLFTEDIASMMSQSIDSVRVMMTSSGRQDEEVIEDPSLIYQRLAIIHQTLKLSSVMPFELEAEPDIVTAVIQPKEEKIEQLQKKEPTMTSFPSDKIDDLIDKKEKGKELLQKPASLNDILNSLTGDLSVLAININNKNVLVKIKDNISKLQNIVISEGRQELVAIISKIAVVFEEQNEGIYNFTEDTAYVLSQTMESVKHMLTGESIEDILEDPGMIYQRLAILHQSLKLSAGMPFEMEPELKIFTQPSQEKHQIKIIKPEEPKIKEKIEAKPETKIEKVKEKAKPQIETPIKSTEKETEKGLKTLDKKAPPKKEEKVEKVATVPMKHHKPAPALTHKKGLSPLGEMAKEQPGESPESYTIKTLRVDTRKLDQLVAQVGELIIAKIKAKERLIDIEKLLNLVEEWQRDWAKTKYAVKNLEKRPQKSAFMAEGTSIYTPGKDMQSIIRENSDTLAQLANHLNLLYHNIQEDDTRLTLIINELEERIKNVRLLPLTTIFSMFPRMVRDISREQKKDIELEIYGSETTVDKKIIEEIKSPLMHIIRNSIDHGIEKTEDRINNGKPAGGKVILSAKHLENSVLIEIIDDGRGIDLEAIKAKVIEKELLSTSELEAMTETQIMNIIFWPGFSTGKEVTDISGRGVGMDVVHTKITQLNGKVKVESKLGYGCRVSIQLPVTMATIQVFLVKVAYQTFAIPTSAIKTAVLIKPSEIFFKEGRQTVLVGGIPVFLSSLSELLELPFPKVEKQKKDKLTVLVLQTEDTNIGLIVDGLLGDQEILHKNLEPPLIRVRNVAGVTTLGSGEVCLILNVGDLIKTAQMNYGMALRSSLQQKESVQKKKDILVVDDSVTTRILERNILRAAGYNVTVAVNGLDALMKLNTQHFDLVVSDVEMPDITGFELVSRMKNDNMFSKIPIILVTSLASEVDKQKGMTAGASAYITKGGFDQEELLGTIRRLII